MSSVRCVFSNDVENIFEFDLVGFSWHSFYLNVFNI